MATRQRKPPSRKSSSSQSASSGPASQTSGTQTDESPALRATFAPDAYESTAPNASENADIPKATFVGEQLLYQDRTVRIAEAAYFRAQQRGFAPGFELEDWLGAEREIDALLPSDTTSPTQQ